VAHKDRPRGFLPLDLQYLSQDTIVELGEEFGAAGPLAFLVILLEAKAAAAGGLSPAKQGSLTMRYRALARQAYLTDAETARRIVAKAADLGLLLIEGGDPQHFTARLVKWHRWEPKDVGAAARKQAQRSRDREDGDA
jgi:hypothetical protein